MRRFLYPLRRAAIVAKPFSTTTHAAAASTGSAQASPNLATHRASMPPGFQADVGQLSTFDLPSRVTGSTADTALGKALISAWRRDGILQLSMTVSQQRLWNDAHAASRRFFRRPHTEKAACVDPLSYSGYIASGEEVTAGVADYSEIFTVTKDLGHEDPRVGAGWPCHGPCPWPDEGMKIAMMRYKDELGREGEKMLRLVELGLGLQLGRLTGYTRDGWHHMRVLR